ncbi:MAG: hypothetical protein JW761_14405 [Prolixibacteraceae bacterium]|nr:hypothetical protein [Prolixibacteraceae bacterium]
MKEKDYIEELILKNREELNDNEPTEGHFERFENRLKLQDKKKKLSLNLVWKVAAAVIFVFLAGNQIAIYLSSPENENKTTNTANSLSLASVSPEYQEVEYYYTNAIDAGLTQWESLSNEGFISQEEQEMMQEELAEFEQRLNNLRKDLAANPNDERVINAMLEYYQAKLSVINMIVNKLEEVKQQQKNTQHEIEI